MRGKWFTVRHRRELNPYAGWVLQTWGCSLPLAVLYDMPGLIWKYLLYWTSHMRGTISLYYAADLGGAWDIEYLSTDKTEVCLVMPRRVALPTGIILYTGEIQFSYLIQIGLLDSASAKIKAIGAQLPAEFYLLGSHSSHKISWHSAALLCEACDCCHVLQGMVGKVQWCHMCWPQRGPSLVVLCQCSCPQCNAQVMPRKGKHVLSLLPPPVLTWPVGWWHRRSPVLM